MSTTSETTKRTAPAARWPLGRRTRQTVLVVHIVSAGAWIGIDVIVAVLVLTGWFGGDADTRGIAYQALSRFVVWPMLTAGLTCLVTGLLLGMATKWGLVRYWWVAVKLVLNLVLCTLILVALQPGMAEVGEYGEALVAGGSHDDAVVSRAVLPAGRLAHRAQPGHGARRGEAVGQDAPPRGGRIEGCAEVTMRA